MKPDRPRGAVQRPALSVAPLLVSPAVSSSVLCRVPPDGRRTARPHHPPVLQSKQVTRQLRLF